MLRALAGSITEGRHGAMNGPPALQTLPTHRVNLASVLLALALLVALALAQSGARERMKTTIYLV
jgi:hypothetical protein